MPNPVLSVADGTLRSAFLARLLSMRKSLSSPPRVTSRATPPGRRCAFLETLTSARPSRVLLAAAATHQPPPASPAAGYNSPAESFEDWLGRPYPKQRRMLRTVGLKKAQQAIRYQHREN
ncbi:hypothetical protein VTN96DRAFT_8260 [Rasamsonia emersonii]